MSGTETDTQTQSGTFQTTHTQTGQFDTETLLTGTKTEEVEQSGTMEDKTDYGKVIDVTASNLSTQEMIQKTIDLYDQDFVARWLMRFFNAYCVYT